MCILLFIFYELMLRPLLITVAVTHIEYVIFKAKRALLIPRRLQHCTFPHENQKLQNTGENIIRHQRLYSRLSPILHLTWEETLMWNSLIIYCDWCLNSCMSIFLLVACVLFIYFSFFKPFFILCVSREGTLKAGDRVLSIDGMPLNRERHADALTMLMQSSQEALFLIEYDISVMGELTHTHTCAGMVGRHCSEGKYCSRLAAWMWVSVGVGDATRGVTQAREHISIEKRGRWVLFYYLYSKIIKIFKKYVFSGFTLSSLHMSQIKVTLFPTMTLHFLRGFIKKKYSGSLLHLFKY